MQIRTTYLLQTGVTALVTMLGLAGCAVESFSGTSSPGLERAEYALYGRVTEIELVQGAAAEPSLRPKRETYHVAVRLDGGAYRVYEQETVGAISVGDQVRIVNGRVSRR